VSIWKRHVVSKKHDLNALQHDAAHQELPKEKARTSPLNNALSLSTSPFATSPSHSSLVLRHPLRRRSIPIPALLPTMHHNRRLLSRASRSSINLLLHIRAVLYILAEIANVAAHLLVRLEREGDNGHEAECEPFPALGYLLRCMSC
jgi:hypothetical protein